MIERPPHRKYCISDKEIWDILVATEMQGGNKQYAWKINTILQTIVDRYNK